MYQLLKDLRTGVDLPIIHRLEDNCFISMSEENADYQAYLAWLAEGNTPLPADEPT